MNLNPPCSDPADVRRWEARLLTALEACGNLSLAAVAAWDGAQGEQRLLLGEDPGSNTVLWEGLNESLADALIGLVKTGRMNCRPTSPLVYAVDGAVLKLPIARRPGYRYRRPHWLPVLYTRPEAP